LRRLVNAGLSTTGHNALDVGAAGVKDFRASGSLRGVFRVALGEIALRLGHRFRVAKRGTRGAVEDAADGPASVLFREGALSPREKDLAGAVLLRPVVPA
jgi:hypothetical protein